MEPDVLDVPDIESHTFQADLECHFLLHRPEEPDDLLFLALHGYGMNPRTMLDLSVLALGKHRLVASLQAPNQFYLQSQPPSTTVGYNWGTRDHGTASIRLHHEMIRRVRRVLEARFGMPAARTVLIGFSQPVGYNYRFAATFPDDIG